MRRFFIECAVLLVLLMVADASASTRLVVEGQRGTEAFVKYLKKESPQLIDKVFQQLGVQSPRSLRVFVARDAAEMRETALKEQGGLPPEWAAGLAYPKRGVIYVHFRAPLEELQKTQEGQHEDGAPLQEEENAPLLEQGQGQEEQQE